ncbi:response regulator [Chloroflexota bacterium]
MTMPKVRVLVADKNTLIGDGICAILRTYDSIEVVGVASKSQSAMENVRCQPPDVVLMDAEMSFDDDGGLICRIRSEYSDIKFLLISERDDREYVMRGLKAGGHGYILKRATPAELVTAIVAVSQGGYFLYPPVAKLMVGEYLRLRRWLKPDPYALLSQCDRDLLRLLTEGCRNRQIAESLHIKPETVTKHKARLMSRLGLHNRTELIKYAIVANQRNETLHKPNTLV